MQRPRDKLLRRLNALYHNGYVDRPRAQIELFTRGGSAPLIYAPGHKAPLLFGAAENLDWTQKNRSVRRPYLEHTLMVADFMVALECAIRSHPGVRLIRAAEIQEEFRQRTGRDLRSWTMWIAGTGLPEIAAVPDKVFALEFAATGRRNYFLLEADRSKMPIERTALDQSSFKKKLLCYHHGHAAKRHQELWGMPGFRVLTITRSEKRIDSMLAMLGDITHGKGSNVFLFASADAVADPLGAEWMGGKGQVVKLIGS